MVSAKFLDDEKISNADYARIGGIARVTDLNILEMEFLNTVNYCLTAERPIFEEIYLLLQDPPAN